MIAYFLLLNFHVVIGTHYHDHHHQHQQSKSRMMMMNNVTTAAATTTTTINGHWGSLFDMKVIPIHTMLLLNGNVFSYGSGFNGYQGAKVYYEIWHTNQNDHHHTHQQQDQRQEEDHYHDDHHHTLLRHDTSVNIFCSTTSIDVITGNVLIFGGDDNFNNGIHDVTELNIKTLKIQKHVDGIMNYGRWYATSITLPDGRIFVIGGKSDNPNGEEFIGIPEIWSPGIGLQTLDDATIPEMNNFINRQWYYPHAYVNSQGDIIVILGHLRRQNVYNINYNNNNNANYNNNIGVTTSTATVVGHRPFRMNKLDPSIMYDIDKVIMLDSLGNLWDVDISNGNHIIFTKKSTLGQPRTGGIFSLLPNGQIVITGGNSIPGNNGNILSGAVYHVQIIDPSSINWKVSNGPAQTLPRLYHSSATVLLDGTVMSAGGGAPGPLQNLNGQLYYPQYMNLHQNNTTTKTTTTKLIINRWPRTLRAGNNFILKVSNATNVARVTTTNPGSSTHGRNCEARFLNLEFEILDSVTVRIINVPNRNVFKPGVWILNVLDHNNIPSVGRLTGVNLGFPRIQLMVGGDGDGEDNNKSLACAHANSIMTNNNINDNVYLESCDILRSWILIRHKTTMATSMTGETKVPHHLVSFRTVQDRNQCLQHDTNQRRRMKVRPCNLGNRLQHFTIVGDYYNNNHNRGLHIYPSDDDDDISTSSSSTTTTNGNCLQHQGPVANITANLLIIVAPCNDRKDPWYIKFL